MWTCKGMDALRLWSGRETTETEAPGPSCFLQAPSTLAGHVWPWSGHSPPWLQISFLSNEESQWSDHKYLLALKLWAHYWVAFSSVSASKDDERIFRIIYRQLSLKLTHHFFDISQWLWILGLSGQMRFFDIDLLDLTVKSMRARSGTVLNIHTSWSWVQWMVTRRVVNLCSIDLN